MKMKSKPGPKPGEETEEELREEIARLKKESADHEATRRDKMVFSNEGPTDAIRRRCENAGGVFVTAADRAESSKRRAQRIRNAKVLQGLQIDAQAQALGLPTFAPPVAPPAPPPTSKKVKFGKSGKPAAVPAADPVIDAVSESEDLPPA